MSQRARKHRPTLSRAYPIPQTEPALSPDAQALRADDITEERKLEVSSGYRFGIHLRTSLTRYVDPELSRPDALSLDLTGCALRNGGTFSHGDGVSVEVCSSDTLRALGHCLFSLADEADRRGMFEGVKNWDVR